jgi:hypothetical protein
MSASPVRLANTSGHGEASPKPLELSDEMAEKGLAISDHEFQALETSLQIRLA